MRRYTDEMDCKFAKKFLILTIASNLLAVSAFAQWQWVDASGRKVFSDTAPPSSIKDQNILKRPSSKTPSTTSTTPTASLDPAPLPSTASSSPVGSASVPKPTGKDLQLEAKKKQAENEQAAQRKADGEKTTRAKSEGCESAKRSLATLQSGIRIVSINAKGEQEVMDESQRLKEQSYAESIVKSNC